MSTTERTVATLAEWQRKLYIKIRAEHEPGMRQEMRFQAETLGQAITLLGRADDTEACTSCEVNRAAALEADRRLALQGEKARAEAATLRRASTEGFQHPRAPRLAEGPAGAPRWRKVLDGAPALDRRTLVVFVRVVAAHFSMTPDLVFAAFGPGPHTNARHLAMHILGHYKCEKPLLLFRWIATMGAVPMARGAYAHARARFTEDWNAIVRGISQALDHGFLEIDLDDVIKLEAQYGTEA